MPVAGQTPLPPWKETLATPASTGPTTGRILQCLWQDTRVRAEGAAWGSEREDLSLVEAIHSHKAVLDVGLPRGSINLVFKLSTQEGHFAIWPRAAELQTVADEELRH